MCDEANRAHAVTCWPRLYAAWYESYSFHLLKSGMKFSRISRAESFPVSPSKHSQSHSLSNPTSRTGNSTRLPSFVSRLPRLGQLGLHPLARHAVLRQDQQQPVMQPNGLVNLLMDLLARLHVVRRKPASHALGL